MTDAPCGAATRFRSISGRSAPCVRPETRGVGNQRENVNAQTSSPKVCSFQLPKVCSFRLPLTRRTTDPNSRRPGPPAESGGVAAASACARSASTVGRSAPYCTRMHSGLFKSRVFRIAGGSAGAWVGFGWLAGDVDSSCWRVCGARRGGCGASCRPADAADCPVSRGGAGLSGGTPALSRTTGPGRRRGPPAAGRRSAGWREAGVRSGPRGARWRWPRWSGRPGCAADGRHARGSGPRRR